MEPANLLWTKFIQKRNLLFKRKLLCKTHVAVSDGLFQLDSRLPQICHCMAGTNPEMKAGEPGNMEEIHVLALRDTPTPGKTYADQVQSSVSFQGSHHRASHLRCYLITPFGQGLLTKPCQSRASIRRPFTVAAKCRLSLPIDSPLHMLRS